MSTPNTTKTAPSAAPGAAPGSPAAAVPAPSAPAVDSLEHYSRLASLSLKAPETPAEQPSAEPPAAGSGSPPAAGAVPEGGAEPKPPTEVQTPGAPAEPELPAAAAPSAEPEPEEAEPSPEEQATWTEGERRLHGALQKERHNRKEARKELQALRQQVEELTTRLNAAPQPGTPAATPPAGAAPSAPAQPEPAAPVAAPALADCTTFEAVDARAMQAASTEAHALKLQTTLARQGREAVAAELARTGLKEVDGTPVAEATEEQLGEFLARVHEGARLTQLQASPRKAFLAQQAASWQQAAEQMPELTDPKSARAQAFRAVVQANPWLRNLGPQWPRVVVTQLLGQEALQAKNTKPQTPSSKPAGATPAARPAATPPAAPAARTLPGAPARAAGALPQKGKAEELRAKIANGTATLAEVQELTAMSLRAGAGPVSA